MTRLILKGIVGLTLLPFISANITHIYAHPTVGIDGLALLWIYAMVHIVSQMV